jgi:hypothetical protein
MDTIIFIHKVYGYGHICHKLQVSIANKSPFFVDSCTSHISLAGVVTLTRLIFSTKKTMAAAPTNKENSDARTLRKRLAARLRQQRCRARKRVADPLHRRVLRAEKSSQVAGPHSPKTAPTPPIPAPPAPSVRMPHHGAPAFGLRPPVHFIPPPSQHMRYFPAVPHPPVGVHVTISYQGHPPHRSFMVPHLPPAHHHQHHPMVRPPMPMIMHSVAPMQSVAPLMKFSAPPPRSTHRSFVVTRTVSEEEVSPPRNDAEKRASGGAGKTKKGVTPLATKEKAAVDAMLSLGSTSDSSSTEGGEEEGSAKVPAPPKPAVVYAPRSLHAMPLFYPAAFLQQSQHV